MQELLQIGIGLLGGLAIFLYGMKLMSSSLQEAAGARMRSILAAVTKNPLLGVLTGAVATAVLQSSSATTVMAIGFVSAGLMRLPQAIPIIMGANIGTTITAQIIAFKLSDYVLAIVFAGFVMMSLAKQQKAKLAGTAVFGFGLLFLGIDTMGGVMKPLAENPVFTAMIAQVTGVPLLGVAVGTFMTLIVQSSSATIAVLQNFAAQPGPDGASLIGLQGAIPILLGDNLGTTVTALFACIGQSRDAKRVALSHCLFNLSGCLLFIWFVGPFAALVAAIPPAGAEVEVIARQIANAHTLFNVIMTGLWLPFVPLMAKMVTAILPDKGDIPRNPLGTRDEIAGAAA
ncbi:MAG: Na/Pi cotransporter family protein [Eggerthellaceae bacterium]|nr:Na/Pi cotransporter family protein [Eggerthellaceae bacterium]